MKENEKGLQKLNTDSIFPVSFDSLSEQEKKELTKKVLENEININKEKKEKVLKSQVAEHDLAVVADAVDRMDAERKYYEFKQTLETGSGKVDVKIKGGDTKFIVPILVVIGLVLLGLLFLFKR